MNLDGKYDRIFQNLKKKYSKIYKSTAKMVSWWLRYILLQFFYLMVKDVFFHENQVGIDAWGRKVAEMGHKWLLLAKNLLL